MPEVANVNMSVIAERAIRVTKSRLGRQHYYRTRTCDEVEICIETLVCSRGQSWNAGVWLDSETIYIAVRQTPDQLFQMLIGRKDRSRLALTEATTGNSVSRESPLEEQLIRR